MSAYLTQRVSYRHSLGSEQYEGLPPLAAAVTVIGRDRGIKLVERGDNTVTRKIWWLDPALDEVLPGGTVEGHRIREVEEGRDVHDLRTFWVVYCES